MSGAGDGIKAENASWKFSGEVVDRFEEHIQKSVPFYEEGHALILKLSDYFVKEDSICYELGSSTGKLSFALASRHRQKGAKFVGLEIEEEMHAYATRHYRSQNLHFEREDVTVYPFQKSDLIISYYTMQFVHPKHRQKLFDTIYDRLEWGGAFILYEKVRAPDARFQDIVTTLYDEYKVEKGYSAEEIFAKTMSLKGVLEPFSTQANLDLLKRAGFVDVMSIQKYLNFEGFLAIK